MEKNDVIIGSAEALGTNGEGIVRKDGVTLFVPFLLPGERAEIKILRCKGNIAYGKVTEIFTPAEERVRPECPVFGRCGGCRLQHIKYRYQLAFKQSLVHDALKKIGGVECSVSRPERSEREYGYRNKLQLPIGRQNGKNVVGFYAERSHRIVPTSVCPIHPAWSEKLIAAVYQFMETCGLDGYDETSGTGVLRHIVVRELKRKYLVTLVTAERTLPGVDYFLFLLDKIFPEYSFYLNYNPERTNVIFGKEFTLLKGSGFYECTESGISFEAGANTFVQVNEGVKSKLYERAVSLVGEEETVVDCYAGGGLLTAMFAQKCRRAYGIEIVPEATACADALAERNGLKEKMTNLNGAVEDILPGLLKEIGASTVVLDPPRSGAERSVIDALSAGDVQKLLYISCNPATLARDVGLLTGSLQPNERGELVKTEISEPRYRIKLVQPFDMFPQTKWVETLVVLSHKKPDGHIGVKVEFGEDEGQISLKEVEKRAEERKPKEKSYL